MELATDPEIAACDQERVLREIRNAKKAAWGLGDLNLVMRAIDREINILGLDERSRLEEHLRQQESKVVNLMKRFMEFTFEYIDDAEHPKRNPPAIRANVRPEAAGDERLGSAHPPQGESVRSWGSLFSGGWGVVEATNTFPQTEHWGRGAVRSSSTAPEFRAADQSSVPERPSHTRP